MTTQREFGRRVQELIGTSAAILTAEINGATPQQTAPLWAQVRAEALGLRITLTEQQIRRNYAQRTRR